MTGDTQPIRLLHLSDVHFSAGRVWDADPVLRALARFIAEEVKAGLIPDLVVFTGDLAFSGKTEEYALARVWLEDQLWPILGGLARDRLLVVAGNHDVDRGKVSKGAKSIQSDLLDHTQDAIAEVLKDDDDRNILIKRHAAYLTFLEDWSGVPQVLPWWERIIEIRGIRLHVAGLDSALLAHGDEDRGRLLISRYQLNQTVVTAEAEGADWRLALLHHPWDYLAEWDMSEVREAVHQHRDLVLRGHLHHPSSERIVPPDPQRACLELAAGCLYEHSRYPNAFQWIELHSKPRRVKVSFRCWLRGEWTVDRNLRGCPDGQAEFPTGGTTSHGIRSAPLFSGNPDGVSNPVKAPTAVAAGPNLAIEQDQGEPQARPRRFFISYRRQTVDDSRLANLLTQALRGAGHEVFIDVDIPLGTDWSAEIAQRVQWCDYFVVLLSEDSVDSEMVRGEIRLARHYRREDGSPFIFPVRIAYQGSLDYELSVYIGRLQHIAWRDVTGDKAVVDAILAAARAGSGPAAAEITDFPITECLESITGQQRPRPSVDPGALLRPTGTLRLNDRFYIARPEDAKVAQFAANEGITLVIKGPRQVGKSSLLVRYLAACKHHGKQAAFLDFQGISDAQLTDYPGFLHHFVSILLRRFNLPSDSFKTLDSGLDATDAIETQLLNRIEAPVVLAFEGADRLLGCPWQNDFFRMLTSWHNKRWDIWAKVDLAIAIATEPYLLVDSAYQSAFSVGDVVELGRFGTSQVTDLNERYGATLSQRQCRALFELTDGQPYLTRVALHKLSSEGATWSALQAAADGDPGPFADHLKALLMLLHRAGLEESMREVIRCGRIPGDDRLTFYRLRGAGLVKEECGRLVPANLLYARFFKRVLR